MVTCYVSVVKIENHRMPRTHYDNLQVSRTASDRVIRAAYKSLVQEWHPDKHPNNRDKAEKFTKIITTAYEILSNSESRKEHDEWIIKEEKKEALLNNQIDRSRTDHHNHVDLYSQSQSAKINNSDLNAANDPVKNRELRIRIALHEKLGREPRINEIERAKWDGMCLDD